jgi:hypothetical protein
MMEDDDKDTVDEKMKDPAIRAKIADSFLDIVRRNSLPRPLSQVMAEWAAKKSRARKISFISGHLDLTRAEFDEHYVPKLEEAMSAGNRFIVGDARGADTFAQAWLAKRGALVTVYHMFQKPRNNQGPFDVVGGFESDSARDEAMTKSSTHDIAWVRPGREKSGTAKNLARRQNA